MLRFIGDRKGVVAVMSAIFLGAMVAVLAFALHLSDLYVVKLKSQRAADLATLAAASTSNAVVSGSPSAAATATALNVAAVNGFASTAVTTTAVAGTKLQTAITLNWPMLPGFSSGSGTSAVGSTATSNIAQTGPAGCVVSLARRIYIGLGASVSGSSCQVRAWTYLEVSLGTLNVGGVAVGTTQVLESLYLLLATSLSPVLTSFQFSQSFTDTIASHASVTALDTRLASMATWPYGTVPPVTATSPTVPFGTNATYSGTTATVAGGTTIQALNATNATLTFSGSGAADPTCATPTSVSGTTTLSGTNTFVFNSGCYIFKGDVNQAGSGTTRFTLATGATVRFIFGSSMTNGSSGTLEFPDATVSVRYNINNNAGGRITFGSGSMTVGGNLYNNYGIVTFGNGPFYFASATISQYGGTITFGNGPFYLYNGGLYNYTFGTINMGDGPYYLYNFTIYNGNGIVTPYMGFRSGPYYHYIGEISLNANSVTVFGAGDFYKYSGSFWMHGRTVTFGASTDAASGAATIALRGGAFYQDGGNLIGNGVTIASTTGEIRFAGTGATVTAPTAGTPIRGYQNVLAYSQSGQIYVGPSGSPALTLSGLLYAPGNTVYFWNGQTTRPGTGGCLSAIADEVQFSLSANVEVAPCPGLSIGGGGVISSAGLQ